MRWVASSRERAIREVESSDGAVFECEVLEDPLPFFGVWLGAVLVKKYRVQLIRPPHWHPHTLTPSHQHQATDRCDLP